MVLGDNNRLARRRFLQMSALTAGGVLLTPDILRAATTTAPITGYGFGTPPAIGAHPRVVSTPADLPAIQARITSGPAKTSFTKLKLAAQGLAQHALVAKLMAGTLTSVTDQETLSKAICGAALVAWLEQNATSPLTIDAKATLLKWVDMLPADESADFSRTSHSIGLAYDWLHGFLSTSEQDMVRQWLVGRILASEARQDAEVYGFLPGHEADRNYNWVTHGVGAFGTTALSVEGEAGYLDRWYTKSVASIHDYMDYGIGTEGAPTELLQYFAYGMWQGSFLVNAMARRGDPVLQHPHLMNVPTWWTSDMFPWGSDWNSIQDTKDLYHGVPPVYYLLRLAYGENPVMRWVYKNFMNAHIPTNDHITSVLWATDPAVDASITIDSLGLNQSQFFAFNGLAYLRDGWGTDDLYFQFQSDPSIFGQSHSHADRNSFTLVGKSRIWVMDAGGWYPNSDGHNLVLIDGKGQGHHVQKGELVTYHDAGWASGIMGNAKTAYDWKTDAEPTTDPAWQLVNGKWSFPFNPVQRAFRSGTVVRGDKTYVMVVDDIRKDDQNHTYSWEILVPISHRVAQRDASSWLLEPVDSGPHLQSTPSNNTPISVPFDIAEQGNYRVWVLVGREYNAPYNPDWRATFALDGGANQNAGGAQHPSSGDHAQPHWIPVPFAGGAAVALSPGTHTLTATPLGSIMHVAMMVAPDGYDPTGLTTPTPPAGSVVKRFADLTLPSSGWALVQAESDYPQCLIQILNPTEATLSATHFVKQRTDGQWAAGFRLKATTTTVEPKFRVLLYPHRHGDPLPTISADASQATVSWPNGVLDSWRFGPSADFPAANGASVQVSRGSQTFTLDVDFASLSRLTSEYVAETGLCAALQAIVQNAESLDRKGRTRSRNEMLDSYSRTLERARPIDLPAHQAELLTRQARLLQR